MELNNKKKYSSAEQKLRLIQLVEADPQLKSGKFSSTFTKNEAKIRWLNIAKELNSITGANKTWEEWRKTWQDRKANAKKKFVSLRRQANLTGGGPPLDPPTLEEQLLLNSFDQQSLVGHTDSQESAVSFIDLSQPGNSVESHTPKLDLSYPVCPENPEDKDQRQIIDVLQPDEFPDSTKNRNLGNASKKEILPEACPTNFQIKRRRTVAQRRLQEGLNAVQTLNKSLQEKNLIKKKFYEEFINLMTMQTKALVDIAAALNNK